MKKVIVVMSLLSMLWFTGVAGAVLLDLAPPPETYQNQYYKGGWYAGVGVDRGFLFDALQPFTLNSVGIEIDPYATTTLTASLYAVTGVDTVGALLASNSQVSADLGRGWYDVALAHTFPGGSRYLLNIVFNPGAAEATFYDFEGRGDGGQPIDPPYTVGPVSVFDGTTGLAISNYVLAHFRMEVNAAPLPGAAWLLGSCLLGMAGWRRLRQS